MEPAEILDAAADLIEEKGWWQGSEFGPDGEMCASAAIAKAMAGWTIEGLAARALLQEAVLPFVDVPSWNDAPGRTMSNVVQTMRQVAQEARE